MISKISNVPPAILKYCKISNNRAIPNTYMEFNNKDFFDILCAKLMLIKKKLNVQHISGRKFLIIENTILLFVTYLILNKI